VGDLPGDFMLLCCRRYGELEPEFYLCIVGLFERVGLLFGLLPLEFCFLNFGLFLEGL